ncbi:hypothetical protein [Bradyrhizobium australiense]|uniref:hypothetical protein n=1 Tax=Bradyrhizobium australiense TaxID=2721161 RepID=UPI001AEEBE17|nr:hypothetical protein [Bradyrhizobium australiense]
MEVVGLINWTIQKAQGLKAKPSDHDRGPSLEWLLSILEPEPAASTKLEGHPNDSIANSRNTPVAAGEPIQRPSCEVVPSDNMSGIPSAAPEALAASPEAQNDGSKSNLLTAILEPHIHTAPENRDRAIALRWVLRDIKSNRAKLSPISPEDLRALIELDLVETRDDAVVLTTAGASAVL